MKGVIRLREFYQTHTEPIYDEEPLDVNIKSAAEISCDQVSSDRQCTKIERIYCQYSCNLCNRK